MRNRFLIILFVIILSVFMLSLLFSEYGPSRNVRLRILGLFFIQKTPTESDVFILFDRIIKGEDKLLLEIKRDDICYWIRPTNEGAEHLLEIKEYQNSGVIKGCIGIPKNTSYIILDHPINLRGIDCTCSGNIYQVERESNGLKITRG
jgi:hypothetical protein